MDNQQHVELLIALDAKMDGIVDSLTEIKRNNIQVEKILLIGNGKPSVLDRLTALEAGQSENKKVCEACEFPIFKETFDKFKTKALTVIVGGFVMVLVFMILEHSTIAMQALGLK